MEPTPPAPPLPETPQGPTTREIVRRLGPTGVLGAAWAVMPAVMGVTLLYHIDTLSGWLRQNPTLGLVGYISVFIISAGLGLLPTYAQAILGGWVFGMAWGLPAALAGFTGGSIVGYFTARTVAQHRVEEVIEAKPRWRAVRDALVGGGFWKTLGLVALVRVPPNSPFALTNLVLSTTGVPLPPYALGTAVGMLPRTAIAVGLAAAASHAAGDAGLGAFVRESRQNKFIIIGGIAATVVVLAVVGHIGNKALARATRMGAPGAPSREPPAA
jgi:uncharacterized membrane protein YdjX (TVP38/TMEM64 family)